MRALVCVALAAILLATPLSAGVALPGPTPLPPELARADSDGGRTLLTTIDDGEGGAWRTFPVSDAGLAAFSGALVSAGVAADPVVYAGDLKELGAFLHAWEMDGTPFVTLGVYTTTASQGTLRVPAVIVENVTDLEALGMLVASVVADDALPIAAEALPHAYALAAPDLVLTGILGGVVTILTGELLESAVHEVAGFDESNGIANVPPEAYPALAHVARAVSFFGYPLAYGQFGIGGGYGQYTNEPSPPDAMTHDWTDRPEVRLWTARKVAGGSDVWVGAALSRTGANEGDGVYEFHAWKRLAVGPATRIDGVVSSPAGAYVRADAHRSYQDEFGSGGASNIVNDMVVTIGAYAAGADTPLAQARMHEERHDTTDEGDSAFLDDVEYEFGIGDGQATYLPEEQSSFWSAGVVVAGEYVPLAGARTDAWHRVHHDLTNLGEPILEWESERLSSGGAFVAGAYTPLVGARTWLERSPAEFYAVQFVDEGVGSQRVGDMEASVGTFVLGEYAPLAGTRYDDDFALHLHDHRAMVSAGTYLGGAYQPLVGATYDGEDTVLGIALQDGTLRWQTSTGFFTLGFYRPVLGTRFVPETATAQHGTQESYQIGIYPLYYDPFIPVASLDFSAGVTSVDWALAMAGDDAGPAGVDVVAYTPGPYAFPLVGARYATDAPDMVGAHDAHLALGVYDPEGAFTPLVGVSYAGQAGPVALATSLAQQAAGGARHKEADVSVGVYVGGVYTPLATVSTELSPV